MVYIHLSYYSFNFVNIKSILKYKLSSKKSSLINPLKSSLQIDLKRIFRQFHKQNMLLYS